MTDVAFPIFPIASVLPHDGPMVLLDEVVRWCDDGIQCKVTVAQESLFADALGVPAWVGMEYMAQAIAALAGCKARLHNEPVRIGFLLGSRRYESTRPAFPLGTELSVTAHESVRGDNGLSVFECRIESGDKHISAKANINVFQPEDAEQFVQEDAQ